MGSIVAQGDSDSIGCRFVVTGVVRAETIAREVYPFTVYLLRAA